jgi:hypothetical protein
MVNSATFHFGRGLAYGMINIYVVKTASVFMITTSTIGVYTGFTPRWLALGGMWSRPFFWLVATISTGVSWSSQFGFSWSASVF